MRPSGSKADEIVAIYTTVVRKLTGKVPDWLRGKKGRLMVLLRVLGVIEELMEEVEKKEAEERGKPFSPSIFEREGSPTGPYKGNPH